jgi:hypothetical protein
VEFQVKELFSSMRNVAEHVSNEARTNGETFPFVTLPFFEVIGAQARQVSGIEALYWGPLLPGASDESLWAYYSDAHQNWLTESRKIELSRGNTNLGEYGNSSIIPFIWESNELGEVVPPSGKGHHQPIWQISPPPFSPHVVNYNLRHAYNIDRVHEAASTLRHGVIDRVTDSSLYSGLFQSIQTHEAYHDTLVQKEKGENYTASMQPHTLFVEPIYADLFNQDTSPIVAHAFGLMTWDRYVADLLPEGVSGITVVIRNTCGQTFTYDLNENDVRIKRKTGTFVQEPALTRLCILYHPGVLQGRRRCPRHKV